MQPEGEKLEEQHAPRRRPDARRQDIKTADEAASYDLTRDAALNLERMAGPNSCLPCATWNHLCGMGFRMSGYVPVYEKARVNINLEVANKHWLAVTIGGLSQIGGRLSRTVCPYVRLHVLSLHSGDYILSVPLVPAGEADNLSKEGRPLAALNTAPCRLGALDADVHWDETFLIDAQFTAVTSPNSLLLFEVLDNPPSIKKSNDAGAGKKGKFSACLAWAYLIPRGTRSGRLNFAVPTDRGDPRREGRDGGEGSNADDVAVDEKSALLSQKAEDNEASAFLPARLQLYEYREESWLVEGLQRRNMTWQPRPSQGLLKTPTNPVAHAASTALVGHRVVPEVYLQWRRQRHVKAAGVLSVMMSYQRRSLGSLMHVVSQDAGVAPDSMTRPIDGDEKRSLAKVFFFPFSVKFVYAVFYVRMRRSGQL